MPRSVKTAVWLVAGAIVLGLLLTGLQAVGGSVHARQSVRTGELSRIAGATGGPRGIAPDNTPASATAVRAIEHLPMAGPIGPDKVVAGVYVSNIQQVDLTTNSFDADF